jgi:Uma2 family endonuclease
LVTAFARDRLALPHAELRETPSAEQIMAMPSVERRWTAREVRELIAESPLATPRYELVDGELLVTPSPIPRHQRAVVRLVVALDAYVRAQHLGHVLTSPSDVELEPEFVSQPDVYVVSTDEWRRMGGRFPTHSLLLAIEVLSPTSARHDRVRKRPYYQRNVPEYWIVDLDARVIERWTSTDKRAELVTQSLEWLPSGATAPFVLDVVAYFDDVFDDD